MIHFFKKTAQKLKVFFQKFTPGKKAWKGASKAVATTAIVAWIIASAFMFIVEPGTLSGVIPVMLGPIIAFLISCGVILSLWLLNKLPKKFLWVLPGSIFLTTFFFGDELQWKFPLLLIAFSALAGAGIYALAKSNRSELTVIQKLTSVFGILAGLAGLIWGLIWIFDTGSKPEIEHFNAAILANYQPPHIDYYHPGEPGEFEFETLFYGSGKDKQREEFSEKVSIKTDSIDGSRLLDNWEGLSGNLRTKFWGFDAKALPLNGRVWFPKGDGSFPLALMVHGNHGMEDFSDPGYAYLGELLASHGIIMVSVDENFLNSSWKDMISGGLDEENDARGWLLLEHLKKWQKWNEDSTSVFYKKVDMKNIAVMGHSRGGEAAAIAAFFNKLDYYSDNAKQKFDFHFNIKSVVAIAPVDGQYTPGNTGTPLENVNYLVLHGANDGDVQSFAGLRQYERVKFTDSLYHFKSAVYIYGANHGQFNTTWGNSDSPQPFASLLNKKALMPMEDQLGIGKTYISAFLQATLQENRAYEPFFKDYRQGRDWIKPTIYLNQYENSDWQIIADFEEDLDLTTTSSGGKINTENLTVWKEKTVGMKWGDKDTRAVYIGWDSLAYEGEIASIEFEIPKELNFTGTSTLTFELSESDENSYPDKERDEELKNAANNSENEEFTEENSVEESESNNEEDEEKEEEKAPFPIDFSILLTDRHGNTAELKLSDYSYLQRQITVDVLKNPELQTNDRSEAVYNTFFIDPRYIATVHGLFDFERLHKVKFIFDQTAQGVIIIDKLAVH